MKKSDKIIKYLKDTYRPFAIIVYGSFSNGSENEGSDFDALLIADSVKKHDTSFIDNTALDVFVYPLEAFRSAYDPKEFVQIRDGRIVLDSNGIAESLQKNVIDYIEHIPQKSADEIRDEISWCEKMLSRTARQDAEGYYRLHLLLVESLEIYCDAKGMRFNGPKKTIRFMEQTDKEAFKLYFAALKTPERETLSKWIDYLKRLSNFR